MIDPETLKQLLEWVPFLSMREDKDRRRRLFPRVMEQLVISVGIVVLVLYVHQSDQQKDIEELKKGQAEISLKLDKIYNDLYQPKVNDNHRR